MAYAALLRYQFADAAGRQLKSFDWHPLSGLSISTVAQWLRSGDFPNSVKTSSVVAGLSQGEYGTDDQAVIERDICPDAGSYVVIEVDWQDGRDPGPPVILLNREVAEDVVRQEQQVHVRLRR
jgi:predicted DNA-binding transcriptional regulator AlpA